MPGLVSGPEEQVRRRLHPPGQVAGGRAGGLAAAAGQGRGDLPRGRARGGAARGQTVAHRPGQHAFPTLSLLRPATM